MAKAIIGAGIAGIPIPVPGSSFITAAPVIAAAEVWRAWKGKEEVDIAKVREVFVAEWEALLNEWSAEVIQFQEDEKTKAAKTARWTKVAEAWLKVHGAFEKSLRADILAFVLRQLKEVSARAKQLGATVTGNARKVSARLFDPRSWDAKLRAAVQDSIRDAIIAGAVAELKQSQPKSRRAYFEWLRTKKKPTAAELRLDLPDEYVDEVDRFTRDLLKKPYWQDLNNTTRDKITRLVDEAINGGMSGRELSGLIQDAAPGYAAWRADNTSRTEATGSLNAGHQLVREALSAQGLVKGKEWLAILDDDTRESHEDAHGQQVPVEDEFTVGNETGMYPGDPTLSAEERCNCRCTSVSITVADEMEDEEDSGGD